MNRHAAWFLVALSTLATSTLFGGCSKSAPPAGKSFAVDQVCNGEDGSRVRLTGYVRYRRGLLSFCSTYGSKKTCDLALYLAPEAPPDFNVLSPQKGPPPVYAQLTLPVGDQPGEMTDLPKKFSASDIHVYLANGASAAEGAHVVIDGALSVIPGDPKTPSAPKQCFVTVDWAAAAPGG